MSTVLAWRSVAFGAVSSVRENGTGFGLFRTFDARRSDGSQTFQRSLEKPTFGAVLRPRDRLLVRAGSLDAAIQAAEQVGADRVMKVVVVQPQTIDDCQRGGRPRGLGNRHGAVQGHDLARRASHQLIVELQDL